MRGVIFRKTPGRSCVGAVRLILIHLSLTLIWGGVPRPAVAAGPLSVRLELVENTAEGPAFDRCEIEASLKPRKALHWRVFYGEALKDGGSWEALRSRSGCVAVTSDGAANPWIVRGSPYLLVDLTLQATTTSDRDVGLKVSLVIRKLAGFENSGAPTYNQRTETRTLWVPVAGSTVIPLSIADRKATDTFGFRELLLRFRAVNTGSRKRAEYGEIGVTADEPRSMIFLDGGLVGRTTANGPVVLSAVPIGKHEVSIMDPSGREVRAIAQVVKGSRANVALTLLPTKSNGPLGLRPLGHNLQGSEEFWREKDSAIVVRIPGGEFRMGSVERQGQANEHPQHIVRVRDFLMDKTEVTWGQYKRFQAESSQPLPMSPVWGMPEALPASSITWDQARAFCRWAGARLPSEAEWERAARGDDGRQYPWGNTFDVWRCNTRDGGPHAPTSAGEYPDCVSPFGLLDLAGSVAEWCSDWHDEGYYAKSPTENPMGPETGHTRVSRGGTWMSPAEYTRVSSRLGIEPSWHGPMQGFRCAQDDLKADTK